MSTTSQPPAQPMPVLTTLALRLTVVTCVLFVVTFPVMFAHFNLGVLFTTVTMLSWLIGSLCGLFGAAQTKPKTKGINVFLFSLFGPLLTFLLALVLFRFLL
jgi:hypothetical protein